MARGQKLRGWFFVGGLGARMELGTRLGRLKWSKLIFSEWLCKYLYTSLCYCFYMQIKNSNFWNLLVFRWRRLIKLRGVYLRWFSCSAVRSSSAHEGKIIVFERFHCSLKSIQLNWELVKLVGKFEICSVFANFCKTRPRLSLENEQNMPILALFCT